MEAKVDQAQGPICNAVQTQAALMSALCHRCLRIGRNDPPTCLVDPRMAGGCVQCPTDGYAIMPELPEALAHNAKGNRTSVPVPVR
eukprot:10467546-Alexandrium_andersonii.AAC.1